MENYRKFALELGEWAGKIILKNFVLGMEKENKADGSPVTKTDLEINAKLISEVKRLFPEHGVLAEEESNLLEGGSEYLWVCDPVDGTIPFSNGLPIATFSLALVKDGEPVLAVVVDPFNARTYFAEKGKGAFLNDNKIKVSSKTEFAGNLIFADGWGLAKFDMMPIIRDLQNRQAHVLMLKSFIYGAVNVAIGEGMGAVFPGEKSHDVAAVKLIIEEAGGITSDLKGKSQRYDQDINGLVAANNEIMHEQILNIVNKNL